jgi:hypothetical protein
MSLTFCVAAQLLTPPRFRLTKPHIVYEVHFLHHHWILCCRPNSNPRQLALSWTSLWSDWVSFFWACESCGTAMLIKY